MKTISSILDPNSSKMPIFKPSFCSQFNKDNKCSGHLGLAPDEGRQREGMRIVGGFELPEFVPLLQNLGERRGEKRGEGRGGELVSTTCGRILLPDLGWRGGKLPRSLLPLPFLLHFWSKALSIF